VASSAAAPLYSSQCSNIVRPGWQWPSLVHRLLIVAGVPLGIPGTTNMVRIASVGPDGDANM
jgi:hypothetical protein